MMTLGGTNSSAYLGDLTSHSIIKQYDTWWTLGYKGAYFNDNKLVSTTPVDYAIIDTGTSFIYMPESEYLPFSQQV
jgi:hypothetical protein